VILNLIFASLALLSLALTLWQWFVARRFRLHQRIAQPSSPGKAQQSSDPQPSTLNPQPPLTLLKPLKGCDPATEDCLRSWFTQQYPGPVQVLFGVADAEDAVCGIARRLLQEFPQADAQLIVCGPPRGTNAKVCQLVELERQAKHDLLIISDADVRVPADLLTNVVAPLQQPEVGLVNCFYRLANPTTLAMQWEAIASNADFWSQVLQSASLKPIDFALGAVMATRRQQLAEIGGFQALADCLADDYQLGHRIAQRGRRIALSPVVVECWSVPMGWAAVWKHQLRWARTIRVCQPLPYFFSLLSNPTLWPLVWLLARPAAPVLAFALGCGLVRVLSALNLERRLTGQRAPCAHAWLVPLKDLLQAAIWLLSFLGNRIEWRGERLRLRRDGTLVRD
jgi:ceramide glucosyltransferase